jgi:hypothetical protein
VNGITRRKMTRDEPRAEMLIEAGVGAKAPDLHRSWVNLPWGTSEDELRHRLTASYRLVRSSLTTKLIDYLRPTASSV